MSDKKGVGVPSDYKKEAHNKFDVLWKVKIKGRKLLADDIPLHCSLRVFDDLPKEDMNKVKEKIEEFGVHTPDSKKLTFKPIIFHSKQTHRDYYMLKISGMDGACDKFFEYFKKDYGFSHPKFMAHITIDKALYDDINKDGLKPDEIEFDDLTIEEGAGNTIHDFENLEKGFKHVGAALGIATSLAGSPTQTPKMDKPPMQTKPQSQYNSKRMLASIADVESSKGKNENYPAVGGIHHGESAVGRYGLMPNTIRETVHMNRDLKSKYGKALNLKGDDMRRYIHDNPDFENAVAEHHLKRLEHHFGQNPSKLGYAWLEGIRGTYNAEKHKKDIENHWHAKKIRDAYNREK